MGFDWIWLLSVWQTGPAGQQVSRTQSRVAAGSSRRRCRTCARRTSPARASRSPATPCTRTWAATRRWPGCASGSATRGLRLMLDFVPNHTGLDHPWVEEHPEYYIRGHGAGPGAGAAELHLGQAPAGRPAAGLRARSVLPRLAGHAAAQLRQPGHAGGDDRRAGEDRRAVRRRALRHGHARAAGRLRADLGHRRAQPFWPRAIAARARAGSRTSASWPRSTGTSNGRCSSRGSTTPTTSGSTTACAKGMRGRCASTSTPGSTTRTSSPGSWRTTTSRGRRRRSRPDSHEAAAVITFLSPGPALLPSGAVRGPPKAHLAAPGPRARRSRVDEALQQFYERLLAVLRQPAVRDGQWQLLECAPAWDGNWTCGLLHRLRWQAEGPASGSSR